MREEGEGLSLILGPVPESTFFSDYWEHAPLHISRDDASHFAPWLSVQMIETLLSTQALYFPAVQLVRQNEPIENTAYADDSKRILAHRLIEHHQDGATIVVSQAHDKIPSLALLKRHIQSAIQLRCQTNVYLSPPGKQGFNAHYDSHDVFILQVAGSKTFNFYGGGIVRPYAHENFNSSQHPCGELQQSILLKPGDTLYIPRGIMHDAVANETSSLHITLGAYALTKRDLLLEMVEQLTEQDVHFRRSIPRACTPRDIDPNTITDSLIDELTPLISKQLLHKALSSLADSAATNSAADCSDMLTRNFNTSVSGLMLSSRIRVKPESLISSERNGTKLRCRTHGQVIEFSGPFADAVELLLSGESMAVADLAQLENDDRLAVCARLDAANLLQVL